MITHITLRDFRGIAQGTMNKLAQINVLIGPNNSGKTTILEALYLTATADVGCTMVSYSGERVPMFLTTQSLDAVASLTRLVQEMEFPADQLKAFRQRLDAGQLITSWFDGDNLSEWIASGLDPRFWDQGDQVFTHQAGGEE